MRAIGPTHAILSSLNYECSLCAIFCILPLIQTKLMFRIRILDIIFEGHIILRQKFSQVDGNYTSCLEDPIFISRSGDLMFVVTLLSPSRQIRGYYLKSDEDRFLQSPLQFTVHYSPYQSTFYNRN